MTINKNHPGQAIRDIQHFGEEGGVVPVIDVASTSTFMDPKDMERTFFGRVARMFFIQSTFKSYG